MDKNTFDEIFQSERKLFLIDGSKFVSSKRIRKCIEIEQAANLGRSRSCFNVMENSSSKNLRSQAPTRPMVCCLVIICISTVWLSVKNDSVITLYLVPVSFLILTLKLATDRKKRVCSIFLVVFSGLNIYCHRGSLLSSMINPTRDFGEINSKGLNIFFVETNAERNFLTNRQLCAVESASKNNPKARIYVFTMKAKTRENSSRSYLIDANRNIEFKELNLIELFNSTPLLSWFESRSWTTSPYILAHLSDAARLALLWKHGGFYSDLDTITIRDLSQVAMFSSVGHLIEFGNNSLGNGIMNFEKSHPFLNSIMRAFSIQYQPKAWRQTGPLLVQNELKKYCQDEEIYKSQLIDEATFERLVSEHKSSSPGPKWETFKYSNSNSSSIKCDILIYPSSFYYPFDYLQGLKKIFEPHSEIKPLLSTYSLHYYGTQSSKFHVKIGDKSLFERLAKHHCPNVYAKVNREKSRF